MLIAPAVATKRGPTMPTKTKTKPKKPKLPYKHFPLRPHPSGQWYKRHRGRSYYFGVWEDWQAALDRFNREWPAILQGKDPRAEAEQSGTSELTLQELCNRYLEYQDEMVKKGSLTPATFQDQYQAAKLLCETLGKSMRVALLTPADFQRLRSRFERPIDKKRLSPTSVKNRIVRTKAIFNWGIKMDLATAPRYGLAMDPPPIAQVRKYRHEGGLKLFTRVEVKQLLARSQAQMRAMILLGINVGLLPNHFKQVNLFDTLQFLQVYPRSGATALLQSGECGRKLSKEFRHNRVKK
jgi:hypothetical protein